MACLSSVNPAQLLKLARNKTPAGDSFHCHMDSIDESTLYIVANMSRAVWTGLGVLGLLFQVGIWAQTCAESRRET